MSKLKTGKVKQSFIMGALTSSAGVFLSKLIGLFYNIPLVGLAGEENMAYSASAYTYYNVLLQICSAGLPYAIASIVAKYANKDDYKTVMLLRKLSTGILSVSGFAMAVIFALISGPLSHSILGSEAGAQDFVKMRTCFIILSVALFLVPLLYSYRGFYQGLKDIEVYAGTQVLEQLARVVFALAAGWFVVYQLHLDRIWVIYMATAATSVGALTAILYYVRYDRTHIGPVVRAAREQEEPAQNTKELLSELFAFGLPYLISAILGNSQTLINTQFFITVNTSMGMPHDTAMLLYGIVQNQCDKLTSIPQVLGTGFSVSIVPYMTISLENKNYVELRKNIRQCIETTLYIAIPVCFMMAVLSRPIYYIMYGGANLDYGAESLAWSSLLGLATTMTPICTSMLMTLHLRKESLFYLVVGFVVKAVTFYPLIKYTGYTGAITSSVLCSAAIVYLSLAKLKNRFNVDYHLTLKRLLKMLLCCVCMNGAFAILHIIGFEITESSRMLAVVEFAVYALVGFGVYLYTSSLMKIPQSIFHKSVKEVLERLIKRK